MERILLVEDSKDVQDLVTELLPEFEVRTAGRIEDALTILRSESILLSVVDIELPDGNGLTFYSQVQTFPEFKDIPCIFLSAHADLSNKLLAFSLGSEDFIAKPFEPLELRARILAKTRKLREKSKSDSLIYLGALSIDISRQRVFLKRQSEQIPLQLTSKEFKLLCCMAKRKDQVMSREVLLDEVWGHDVVVVDRTVDTHLSRLRQKLRDSGLEIESIAGEGYRLSIEGHA